MDKKELYQKTEKALNQAFEAAKQSVKVISEKAGEAAHITKLLIEKATLEHRLSKKFSDLGSCVYDLAEAGKESITLSDDKIQVIMKETRELDQELVKIEKKIESEKKVNPSDTGSSEKKTV